MKRPTRVMLWIAISLGVIVGVLFAANAVWIYTSGKQLERRLQTLRDAGKPLTVADLAPKPVEPDENAATWLLRAREDMEAVAEELETITATDAYRNGQLQQVEIDKVASTLAAYDKIPGLLERAAACDAYAPSLDYTNNANEFLDSLLKRSSADRMACRYLSSRAIMLQARGKPRAAMDSCRLSLRLTRHFDHEPMLVGYLVAQACRLVGVDRAGQILHQAKLHDSAHDALETELARADPIAAYRHALWTERAFGLDFFRQTGIGRFWLARAPWNNAAIYYLDVIDSELQRASTKASNLASQRRALVTKTRSPWTALADQIMPALDASWDSALRSLTLLRCLRVLNRVKQLESNKAVPLKIEQLKLPADATTDPFTGKPLKMKRGPDGWIVYSVGSNLKDDGGKTEDRLDVGLAPPKREPATANQ